MLMGFSSVDAYWAVLAGALLGLSEILPFIPVTPCHISMVH